MTLPKVVLALACLMSRTMVAQEAKVTELVSKELADLPGKEGLMLLLSILLAPRTQSIGTTRMHLFMCWKARS